MTCPRCGRKVRWYHRKGVGEFRLWHRRCRAAFVGAYRAFGAATDADGIPERVDQVGPPRPCTRCGVLVECPSPSLVGLGSGETAEIYLCGECWRLSFTDPRAYWDGLRAALGWEDHE